MFKLKTGYIASGIITGLILVFNFFQQLPDGKLHIVFCDVGQGDAAYIKFPGGRDMLIDAGPGGFVSSTGQSTPKVLGCLARYMSLFDRRIDVLIISHPEEDHMGGAEEILKRYTVGTVVRSNVVNNTKAFSRVEALLKEKHIPERIVGTGEKITVGNTTLSVLWPLPTALVQTNTPGEVLGVSNMNDKSIVLTLSYGAFDVVFPGDADSHVDAELTAQPLVRPGGIEIIKVPHHGAKTGMTPGFLEWLGPLELAVISVGKNMYGHPAPETIAALKKQTALITRTDEAGDIEIMTDGTTWHMQQTKGNIK